MLGDNFTNSDREGRKRNRFEEECCKLKENSLFGNERLVKNLSSISEREREVNGSWTKQALFRFRLSMTGSSLVIFDRAISGHIWTKMA